LLAAAACGIGAFPLAAQNQIPALPLPSNAPQLSEDDPAIGKLPPSAVDLREQQVKQVDPLEREQEKKDREKAERQARKRVERDNVPVPGSIAESERNAAGRSGPEVEDDDNGAPVQEYTGPAVLSRSYSIGQSLVPEQVRWHDSFGVSNVYDSGVSRSINQDGSLGPRESLYGVAGTWALGGRQYFHRDSLSVDYFGNYSRYSGRTGFTGLNQSITVAYVHRLSRRMTINLSGSGSLLSQNSTLENQPVGAQTIANMNLGSSPSIQIFDSGTKQMNLMADVVWQQSARLSFSMGGGYFGISRDTPLLLGVTGEQARGDITYRFTRQSTIGTYYQFSQYIYPHAVGNSQTDTFGAIYSYAFNRTMQVRFRGGISVLQSLGLVTVPIPPPIAALLGVSVGTADSYATYRTTDISAQFIKDFRHGRTASIAYARGISPGNGVYQTSQQESISGNLNMTVLRSYSLALTVGRDTLSTVTESVVANLGNYQSAYTRVSFGRTYRRGIGANLVVEYRRFGLETSGSVRNQLRVTSGVTWGSGNGKLLPF
jgi:hypothetical protein